MLMLRMARRSLHCGRLAKPTQPELGAALGAAVSRRAFAASSGGNDPTPVLPLDLVQKPVIQKTLPYVGNVAYLTLAGGFMMTDILALRALLAFGYASLSCYHAFQLRPLRIPLAGSIFFVGVNAFFGVKIYLDRQVSLSEEERQIHDEYFLEDMMDYEFQKIIREGEITQQRKMTRLVHAGDVVESLYFILDGEMNQSLDNETHISIGKGTFVGEEAFIGTNGSSTSSMDAMPGCKYVRWNIKKLKALISKSSAAQRALEVKIGRVLANKLKDTSERLSRTEHQLLVMRMAFGTGKVTVEDALRKAFKEYDTDGSGSVDFQEFQDMMKKLSGGSHSVTKAQIRNLFDAVDDDGSGEISITEFLDWLAKEA